MNSTYSTFENEKQSTDATLKDLLNFLNEGKNLGIDQGKIHDLEKKINAIHTINKNEKLKIALIGGFSEGKTSIAAAWLGRIDKSSMKITNAESSDTVAIYDVDDKMQIIDTPGLFGYKEKMCVSGQIEKYKDITKKYVSSAHIILYVMDPLNPIKESHREDLNWLFRDLQLLPRTIFVLSRFDLVANMEDEEDYRSNYEIKKGNVSDRLTSIISLSEKERDCLSITAVAANPFEQGIEYWLVNQDEYQKLSKISKLQESTVEIVRKCGGKDQVINEMRKSIVADILVNQLPIAEAEYRKLEKEVNRLEEMNRNYHQKRQDMREDINQKILSLIDFVKDYYTDLILKSKGVSIETFDNFFEREIGADGILINTTIKNTFEKKLGGINMEAQRLCDGIIHDVYVYNNTVQGLGKQGADFLVKSKCINNQSILAARDGIVGAAKFVGFDLAKYLKFKPWGAVNLAKGLNGLLVTVGLVMELWDSYKQREAEEKFKNGVKEMVKNFEEQRASLLELLGKRDEFIKENCQTYMNLVEIITEVSENVTQAKARRAKFEAWKKHGCRIQDEVAQHSQSSSSKP